MKIESDTEKIIEKKIRALESENEALTEQLQQSEADVSELSQALEEERTRLLFLPFDTTPGSRLYIIVDTSVWMGSEYRFLIDSILKIRDASIVVPLRGML
eukprot:TRINITY_DN6821_c0_g1_i3.p1 TRINITY_DN6821_c0_g1~~TRINITY_DN6821_c0_g1_i3.p1  ORF type:complete len:101 (+),score=7.91 TRINITY_DN6821_c0_g1_i3:256-558(+)